MRARSLSLFVKLIVRLVRRHLAQLLRRIRGEVLVQILRPYSRVHLASLAQVRASSSTVRLHWSISWADMACYLVAEQHSDRRSRVAGDIAYTRRSDRRQGRPGAATGGGTATDDRSSTAIPSVARVGEAHLAAQSPDLHQAAELIEVASVRACCHELLVQSYTAL